MAIEQFKYFQSIDIDLDYDVDWCLAPKAVTSGGTEKNIADRFLISDQGITDDEVSPFYILRFVTLLSPFVLPGVILISSIDHLIVTPRPYRSRDYSLGQSCYESHIAHGRLAFSNSEQRNPS